MKNLAFIGNNESPARLLETFRKQTPGRSGIWGELRGVDNYSDADYFMVIDHLPHNLGVDESKCVFLNAHPETIRSYRDMSGYRGLAKIDAKDGVGFLEWWIDYDYDYLKALLPPIKTKNLGCIMSNQATVQAHHQRRKWLNTFTSKIIDVDFDLYGRIEPFTNLMKRYYRGKLGSEQKGDHMRGKEQIYFDYKYMIEFDNFGKNYFSERVLDWRLLLAMPIYWGGQNVHRYLPENSFRYLDIDGDGSDVVKISQSDFYERNLTHLWSARLFLLDELQLWPRTHKLIFGRYK